MHTIALSLSSSLSKSGSVSMPDAVNPKQIAGERAASYVLTDTVVGLGTGSTAYFAIRRLGERVTEGLSIRGVPTSRQSHDLAREFGIPLTDLGEVERIDLTIDGADEVDSDFNLTKGGGGALLREKIVAAASVREIIVADETKMCRSLGAFPLPVEVTPFGWQATQRSLADLGCVPARRKGNGATFETDNGNYIIDCPFGSIDDPKRLEGQINRIPGVVDCGLFCGLAHHIIIGKSDGTCEELTGPGESPTRGEKA